MSADWQHLKAYGYAPGGYMGRCHSCERTMIDLDKRAITCRECAEKMHAARGMEARQGRDAQRLDGEATTARPEGTRPETPAPQPVAPEGEALRLTKDELSIAVACVRSSARNGRWTAQHKDCASRQQLLAEAEQLDRIADALAATPPSPQAAVATAEEWRDAERYRRLRERERWASVRVDFGRDSTYQRHRICWHANDGWHQVEGDGLDEAMDAFDAALREAGRS